MNKLGTAMLLNVSKVTFVSHESVCVWPAAQTSQKPSQGNKHKYEFVIVDDVKFPSPPQRIAPPVA
jgi:hypothetical protein